MKQGTVITKVIMIIFLAAVVIYLGYSVFSAIYNPLTTITAVPCTAGESYGVTLWLAREEGAVVSDSGITSISLPDGAKVAAGGEIARSYRSQETYEQQQTLNALRQRLQQLEYTYEEGGEVKLDAATIAELDRRIDDGVLSLAGSSARGDLTAAADQAASLRTLVLRRSSSEVDQSLLESNIESLREQISLLNDQVAVNSSRVTVGKAGWFTADCDGFERLLSPEILESCTVEDFEALIRQKPSAPEDAIGCLVTSPEWYAAALIPAEYADAFPRKGYLWLDLDHSLTDLIEVYVERLSAPVDGKCLLVVSCDAYLQRVIRLRSAEVGLVTELYHGIRVPKQAIRMDASGRAGVYVVQGANARFKPVTLLYDNGDNYVVAEDRSSTDNLWTGDEIILAGRDLYDGKVVK